MRRPAEVRRPSALPTTTLDLMGPCSPETACSSRRRAEEAYRYEESVVIEVPVVNDCAIEDCAYNRHPACHAPAITMGDVQHAHCDTFFTSRPKAPTRPPPAGSAPARCPTAGTTRFAAEAVDIRLLRMRIQFTGVDPAELGAATQLRRPARAEPQRSLPVQPAVCGNLT
ncbi:hypothetical protein [Embleya sp. NBC_00896]|uniref:hypothetical protein n=1 Tax=Embleya sp. NBC_00896 TaxID=2975961 RepID=UPI003866DE58|nr:hypothetical protein OG928_45845 [Embleya sp. NBC_00896]